MTRRCSRLAALFLALLAPARTHASEAAPARGGSRGSRLFTPAGVPVDDGFFPVAVWLQNPRNAPRYQAAGINLYVGLWQGPTAEQLRTLEQARMPVICLQTPFGLQNQDNPIIAGWMHEDEPDNAQSLGPGKGYGPPITPDAIGADHRRYRAADPSRPVLLNLGAGVAWDNYRGRGVRSRHPEDYAEYARGCDIASFDIYPVVHPSPEMAGKLEFVSRGVQRLSAWTAGAKPVWNCIECTHIKSADAKPTPAQVRSEVWLSLISGSRGLIYFVHEFKPAFKEAALLDDPEMLAAITAINYQIRELAPVLNGPTLKETVAVTTDGSAGSLLTMAKRHRETRYVFAVNATNRPVRATLTLREPGSASSVTLLGEPREIRVEGGRFADDFGPYGVHLYELRSKSR